MRGPACSRKSRAAAARPAYGDKWRAWLSARSEADPADHPRRLYGRASVQPSAWKLARWSRYRRRCGRRIDAAFRRGRNRESDATDLWGGGSFVEYLVKVQEFVGDHGHGRKLRFRDARIDGRFAGREQLTGVSGLRLVIGEIVPIRTGDDLLLFRVKIACEQALSHVINFSVDAGSAGKEGPLRQHARGFDKLRIVHGDQGLQWRVGALAAHGAVFTRRRVEDIHGRRRGAALPEGVHAAAVELVAGIALVEAGVALVHRDGFPDSIGLIRLHAGAADGWIEQAAGGKGVVTNHLGIHAIARTARQKAIVGIVLQLVFGS